MEESAVKRLAMVLAVQAEIEGMKAANSQHPDGQPYTDAAFRERGQKLYDLAYAHNDQLGI